MESQLMTRRAGRPLIGPKAQTHIPQEQMDWLREEARQRKIPYADVLREVIAAELARRRAGAA